VRAVCCDLRIPRTDFKVGNLIFFCVYLGVNVACLFFSSDDDLGRSWGSLAAANTMLLIVPATRNSILTWGLGLAFDHVVRFHRFCGRFALLCVLVHFLYYAQRWADNATDYVDMTGFIAGAFGLVIFLTSLNYCRRRHFNLFFWSHYSFVGYFVAAYMHVPQTRPFLLVGIGLYLLDKLLRVVWTGCPRRTLLFRNRGADLAQVSFPKSCVTKALGMHRVGQYYFVNFPALSFTEWHPFSVSSGPRELNVELHIRNLGDHTKRIVQLATQQAPLEHKKNNSKAAVDASVKIRVDGPYGRHDFNYRRFPCVMLVGGGVGITPVIGMLKDLYNVGVYSHAERDRVIPHCIEAVYAVWVMRKADDYECFRKVLERCLQRATQEPGRYPALNIWVYVSRGKAGELAEPLIAGRPRFPEIYDQLQENHPGGKASLVFACGPKPMISELWDLSVVRTMKGGRFSFFHEIFDF
jgi:NAD(P)H-flavin reductase